MILWILPRYLVNWRQHGAGLLEPGLTVKDNFEFTWNIWNADWECSSSFKWNSARANIRKHVTMTDLCLALFNKAGYTATSCGRLGRGENARFPTFQLERDGRTGGRMDGRTDGISPHSTGLCPLSGPLPKTEINKADRHKSRAPRNQRPTDRRTDGSTDRKSVL